MTENGRSDLPHPAHPSPFRIGDCLVLPSLNRIECGRETHQIEPRVMQVLVCLAAHPNEVLSRQALFDTVWADSVVCEEALTRTISELRRVFHDDTKTPRVIETIRKGGYRLIAPVRPGTAPPMPGPVPEHESERPAPESERRAPEHESEPPARDSEWRAPGSERPAPEPDSEPPTPEPCPPPQAQDPTPPARRAQRTLRRIGVFSLAAFAVAAISFWGARRFTRAAHSTPALMESRPLTSFPGLELFPALSPDGSMVAFSWAGEHAEKGAPLDVYVMKSRNGTPVRLTKVPLSGCFPSWSPDGTEILFANETKDGHEICTVPVLGGEVRRITALGQPINGMEWSPDGRSVAYSAADSSNEVPRIHLLSLESLAHRALTAPPQHCRGDMEPAFSPDGRNVAFIRINEVGEQEARSVPTEGGEARKLDVGGRRVSGVDWLSRGELIISAASGIDYSLWKVPLEPGEPIRMQMMGGRIQRVSLARTGRLITYEKISFARNIWCVDISRAGAFRRRPEPLIASTQRESEPVFSPDGRSIAFVSDRSGSPEIWICDAAGGHPRRLTDHQAKQLTCPRWSPDGTRVAYTSDAGGTSSIYVADLQSQVARRLLQDGTQILAEWSRRGEDLYYQVDSPGGWEVWRVRSDGTGRTRISDAGYTIIDEASDGRGLLCLKSGEPGIWLLPVDGGPKSLVVSGDVCGDWQEVVAAETGFYFTRRGRESSTLGFHDFATGRSDSLASLEWYAASLALSPDRSMLLYDSIGKIEVDLMLAEVR